MESAEIFGREELCVIQRIACRTPLPQLFARKVQRPTPDLMVGHLVRVLMRTKYMPSLEEGLGALDSQRLMYSNSCNKRVFLVHS